MERLSTLSKINICPHCQKKLPFIVGMGHEPGGESKAKHHFYTLGYIRLALDLVSLGLSFRMSVKVLNMLRGYLAGLERLAAHTTIRDWNIKRNLGQLEPAAGLMLAGTYALITDLSMMVGKRRVLLILAAPLKEWTFERALSVEDVRVAGLYIEPTFKAEDVRDRLAEVQAKHPEMKISYVVSDGGGELIKGIRLNGLIRVADCHHFFAKELKKEYSKDPAYEAFMADVVNFKRKNNMNDNACLLPPRLGHHSRFMNVGLIARWARRLLNWSASVQECERLSPYYEATRWLEKHRAVIEELSQVTETGYKMLKILKIKGLNYSTVTECRLILIEAELPETIELRYDKYFVEGLNDLGNTRLFASGEKPLVCSSDVVESMFGVLKTRTSGRLNSRCLDMSHYAQRKSSQLRIRQYLERITVEQARGKQGELLYCQVQEDRKAIRKTLGP